MGASKIEWTEATWNPVTGCTKVSPGCAHCYAEALTKRYAGRPGWPETFEPWLPGNDTVRLHPDRLDEPLRWKTPRMVFVNSMSDLFHEAIPFDYIDCVFAVMALTPQHTYQCLTKRPERMREYVLNARNRVAALLYNVRYEQGADDPFAGALRVGNRQQWAGLENSPAWRQSPSWRDQDYANAAPSSGVQAAPGLPLGEHSRREHPIRDWGASPRLDILSRPDTGRHGSEPQERTEGRQSPGEPGVGDRFSEPNPRAASAGGEAQQADRFASPEDQTHGTGRDRDKAASSGRDDGQGHSREVRHEASRRIGDLPAEDLAAHLTWPLDNVWLGVTVENQYWAQKRIPALLRIPAAVRFVSAEPLLGPLNLREYSGGLDWVIVGGESGPKHRRFDPDWARQIVADCRKAGVACFVKQLGGVRPGNRLDDLPEDLRVREWPVVKNTEGVRA
jgi:protein gp37